MGDMMFSPDMASIEKVLDGTISRHKALAGNIANVETPGYTRKEVSFEDQLNTLMNKSDGLTPADLDTITHVAKNDENSPRNENGNNVNIEREVVELAKNSMQFETAAQLLTMEFRGLRSAISEGRK